jgi:hypothetical protein
VLVIPETVVLVVLEVVEDEVVKLVELLVDVEELVVVVLRAPAL